MAAHLVTDVREGVRFRVDIGFLARAIVRLHFPEEVIVGGSDHVQIVRGGIAHHGIEIVVGKRILLCPTP